MLLVLIVALVSAGCPFNSKHFTNSQIGKHEVIKDSPNTGTTTNMGCTCDSECGATVDFSNANCDWCYTKDKCGHYSYTRFKYYDWCQYPTIDSYESQSWGDKTNAMQALVTESTTRGSYPNVLGILQESIQTTFEDMWDYMPNGRVKYIHSVGMVCVVDMSITSTKYTGIFQQGTAYGFFRLGSAADVTDSSGTTPGIGMKFMRSGVPSANFVLLHSLDPVTDYNMFGYNQSNHISPPTGATAILATKFKQVSNCVTMVGLSDACRYTQDGTTVADPVFPYKITFATTGQAAVPSSAQTLDELMAAMTAAAPKGTNLYDVYAQESPKSEEELIGKIFTATDCTTSTYGDSKLFIRHQRVEDDWNIRTDWVPDISSEVECGTSSINLTPPPACSTYGEDGCTPLKATE